MRYVDWGLKSVEIKNNARDKLALNSWQDFGNEVLSRVYIQHPMLT